MDHERIQYLLEKHVAGGLNAEETELLEAYLAAGDGQVTGAIYQMLEKAENDPSVAQQDWTGLLGRVLAVDQPKPPPARMIAFLRRYVAAAAILAGAVILAFILSRKPDRTPAATELQADVMPGGNKAILTLADGSNIVLDSTAEGTIAQQGNARVIKLAGGRIDYQLQGRSNADVMINTIRTPRGGQFQVTLPDGTKVWLNAESSITYPAAFKGKERVVNITGEVYFDVKESAAMPFIVSINKNTRIKVLGTQFNINSYADEAAITATLVEGSIRVMHHSADAATLRPGQQARMAATAPPGTLPEILDNVNVAQIVGWKNGIFAFQHTDIRQVMKQLERWYDIEVRYEGDVPALRLSGKMDRGVHLSDVVRFLADYGITARLEKKTLILSTQ